MERKGVADTAAKAVESKPTLPQQQQRKQQQQEDETRHSCKCNDRLLKTPTVNATVGCEEAPHHNSNCHDYPATINIS